MAAQAVTDTQKLAASLHNQCGLCIEPLSEVPPILLAVESQRLDWLKEVVQNGAFINYRLPKPGPTPLGRACSLGLLDMVEFLLDEGADINGTDHMGNGCISRLIHCNEPKPLLKYLLEQGANINQHNKYGATAMHMAAETLSDTTFLRLLKEKGAAMHVKNHCGRTPFAVAVRAGNFDVADFFLDKYDMQKLCKYLGGDLVKPALLAVESGQLEMLQKVVQHGAKIDYDPKTSGVSALGRACSHGLIDMVRYLVSQWADMNKTDDAGNGCISRLVYCSNPAPVLDVLLELGAAINHQNQNGETAMHLAAEIEPGIDFLGLLTEKGANIEVQDNRGYTPLMAAVRGGNMDAIDHLLEHGADYRCRGKWGDDVIQIAALSGHRDVLDSLMDRFQPPQPKRLDALELFATTVPTQCMYGALREVLQTRLEGDCMRRTREITSEVYEPVSWINTLDDLDSIRDDPSEVTLYSFYVRESILGRRHPKVSEGFCQAVEPTASLPYLLYALELRHEQRDGDTGLDEGCLELLRIGSLNLMTSHVGHVHRLFNFACEEISRLGITRCEQTQNSARLVRKAMTVYTHFSGSIMSHAPTPQVAVSLRKVLKLAPSDHSNKNLLHYAMEAPGPALVPLLMCYTGFMGSQVNEADDSGRTPLQIFLQKWKSPGGFLPYYVKQKDVEPVIVCLLREGAHITDEAYQYIAKSILHTPSLPKCSELQRLAGLVVRTQLRNPVQSVPVFLLPLVYTMPPGEDDDVDDDDDCIMLD